MINFFHTHISDESIKLVNQTLKSGFINQGPMVEELEKILNYRGYTYPVLTNSCTSALHLALELIGAEGKEIILPGQSFVATGLAVLMARGKPVFCDIDYDYNASCFDIQDKITENTACILIVNWAGNPCDLDIFNLGIPVIHDLAHSFGYISPARFSCYSFQAIKQVTSADGGLLSCSDEDGYYKAKKMSWFGIDKSIMTRNELGERDCDIDILGYKYNMNDLNASMVLGNLTTFQDRLNRRKEIHNRYQTLQVNGINVIRHGIHSSHWLCNCLVEDRLNFIRKMKSCGIPVSVVDRRIDRHSVFGGMRDLPVQEYIDEHSIHLPLHEALTDDDVELVIKTVESGW